MLNRLWAAVNARRPQNGFTTSAWIANGWSSHPDFGAQ